MHIDDKVKIDALGAVGGALGELAFVVVNGSRAFVARAELTDCVKTAHEYNNNFVFYILGGVVAGVVAGMWYYDVYPSWIDSGKNER